MVCLVEDKLYFSLNEEDDLNFVKNGYGKIVFQFEEKQMDYKVRLHLTQPAMLCLGANLIYFAASSLYGYGMRTEPIGDLETASMGIRLAPASGSLFFYQDKGCEELEDIIAEKVLPKDVDEKELFLLDFEEDAEEVEKKYGRNFKSTALIEIYEKRTGKKQFDDTIIYLNKQGMLGFGIGLIRMAHAFQVGKIFKGCHDIDGIQKTNRLSCLLLTEDSADFEICCAELPDRFTYKRYLDEMWEEVKSVGKIIDKLYATLNGVLSREEVAAWATICRHEDGRDRCKKIRKEIQAISELDQKLATGEYRYGNQEILKIIHELKEKR